MTQALAGMEYLPVQFAQIVAADVRQLDAFQIVPHAFSGIEIWRIARQLLDVEAFGGSAPEEVLDGLSAMDRRAIPDKEDLATEFAQEDAEEPDHGVAVIAVFAYLQEEASVERDATEGREVVLAAPDVQTRRFAPWRPRAHGVRQQVERRFVSPDNSESFLGSLFLSAGQRFSCYCWIASSLRCVARSSGCCRLQPK